MGLSRPVVVQHHGHLTLTLDFQGQILKMLYLRNGRADWHGTKGMWIDRMLHLLCDFQRFPHPWPWPWIFKVKFWKSHISGMGWPIDMELKGCESIKCWTHAVTFNVHLTRDLYLGFSRSNFKKSYLRNGTADQTWNERDVSQNATSTLWLSMSTSPMTLTLDFQGQILKMLYLRNGWADWHGTKGMWIDRMLHPLCDFQHSPHLDLGFSRSNFEKVISQEWDGWLTWN